MTLTARLIALFPPVFFAGLLAIVYSLITAPTLLKFFALILYPYVVPLIIFRLHQLIWPTVDGFYDLTTKKYVPWWGSHQIQLPFIAFPILEHALHMVPGLYSLWLRAWGAKIGRKIHWTPRVEVVDRSLIEVGDYVVIGHISIFVSHMVALIEGRPHLVLKTIKIGKSAFVSADSQLGPGAIVAPKERTKLKARIYWRGEWKD